MYIQIECILYGTIRAAHSFLSNIRVLVYREHYCLSDNFNSFDAMIDTAQTSKRAAKSVFGQHSSHTQPYNNMLVVAGRTLFNDYWFGRFDDVVVLDANAARGGCLTRAQLIDSDLLYVVSYTSVANGFNDSRVFNLFVCARFGVRWVDMGSSRLYWVGRTHVRFVRIINYSVAK